MPKGNKRSRLTRYRPSKTDRFLPRAKTEKIVMDALAKMVCRVHGGVFGVYFKFYFPELDYKSKTRDIIKEEFKRAFPRIKRTALRLKNKRIRKALLSELEARRLKLQGIFASALIELEEMGINVHLKFLRHTSEGHLGQVFVGLTYKGGKPNEYSKIGIDNFTRSLHNAPEGTSLANSISKWKERTLPQFYKAFAELHIYCFELGTAFQIIGEEERSKKIFGRLPQDFMETMQDLNEFAFNFLSKFHAMGHR